MRRGRLLVGALSVLLTGATVGHAGIFCSSCGDRPCCPPFDHPSFGYNPVLWSPWPGTPLATAPPRPVASGEPGRPTEGETAPAPRVMPPAEPEVRLPPRDNDAPPTLNLSRLEPVVVHPRLLNLFDPDLPPVEVSSAVGQESR